LFYLLSWQVLLIRRCPDQSRAASLGTWNAKHVVLADGDISVEVSHDASQEAEGVVMEEIL
jgi:hypothetical protein